MTAREAIKFVSSFITGSFAGTSLPTQDFLQHVISPPTSGEITAQRFEKVAHRYTPKGVALKIMTLLGRPLNREDVEKMQRSSGDKVEKALHVAAVYYVEEAVKQVRSIRDTLRQRHIISLEVHPDVSCLNDALEAMLDTFIVLNEKDKEVGKVVLKKSAQLFKSWLVSVKGDTGKIEKLREEATDDLTSEQVYSSNGTVDVLGLDYTILAMEDIGDTRRRRRLTLLPTAPAVWREKTVSDVGPTQLFGETLRFGDPGFSDAFWSSVSGSPAITGSVALYSLAGSMLPESGLLAVPLGTALGSLATPLVVGAAVGTVAGTAVKLWRSRRAARLSRWLREMSGTASVPEAVSKATIKMENGIGELRQVITVGERAHLKCGTCHEKRRT